MDHLKINSKSAAGCGVGLGVQQQRPPASVRAGVILGCLSCEGSRVQHHTATANSPPVTFY